MKLPNWNLVPWIKDPDIDDVTKRLRVGMVICAFSLACLGGGAAIAEIAGAVIGNGFLVVETAPKKVQHPSGGIVGQIFVKDGDKVQEGDVVLRLDETLTRASLMMVRKQLDELEVRQLRLRAERDGLDAFDLKPELKARLSEPEFAELLQSEGKLFDARRLSRQGQRAQLREKIAQLEEETSGLALQREAKSREIGFVRFELEGSKSLWEKNLYPVTKYTAIQREAARLQGEEGMLIAQIAQARGKIAEIKLQIEQIDQDTRSEAVKELRDIEAKFAEFTERRVAAEDQLRRVDLRAPRAGLVHELSTHTVGGVIAQGETLMQIIPQDDDLVIEARLSPADIDSVYVGQRAYVRFPAFNQKTTPELPAKVIRVGADVSREQTQAGALPYYVVRVALEDGALAQAGGLKLVAGMPVEVHFNTGDRTILSYLLKPLTDQFAKALKER